LKNERGRSQTLQNTTRRQLQPGSKMNYYYMRQVEKGLSKEEEEEKEEWLEGIVFPEKETQFIL
jgi:hypothetical protein